jgi:hypothetical protein
MASQACGISLAAPRGSCRHGNDCLCLTFAGPQFVVLRGVSQGSRGRDGSVGLLKFERLTLKERGYSFIVVRTAVLQGPPDMLDVTQFGVSVCPS